MGTRVPALKDRVGDTAGYSPTKPQHELAPLFAAVVLLIRTSTKQPTLAT